jgi:hypothetical protein
MLEKRKHISYNTPKEYCQSAGAYKFHTLSLALGSKGHPREQMKFSVELFIYSIAHDHLFGQMENKMYVDIADVC